MCQYQSSLTNSKQGKDWNVSTHPIDEIRLEKLKHYGVKAIINEFSEYKGVQKKTKQKKKPADPLKL